MNTYVKRPVVIEAECITPQNLYQLAAWCGGSVKCESLHISHRVIAIQTLEGEMRADMGDYIIKGVKGEFYPCKPDIFHLSYESAS